MQVAIFDDEVFLMLEYLDDLLLGIDLVVQFDGRVLHLQFLQVLFQPQLGRPCVFLEIQACVEGEIGLRHVYVHLLVLLAQEIEVILRLDSQLVLNFEFVLVDRLVLHSGLLVVHEVVRNFKVRIDGLAQLLGPRLLRRLSSESLDDRLVLKLERCLVSIVVFDEISFISMQVVVGPAPPALQMRLLSNFLHALVEQLLVVQGHVVVWKKRISLSGVALGIQLKGQIFF